MKPAKNQAETAVEKQREKARRSKSEDGAESRETRTHWRSETTTRLASCLRLFVHCFLGLVPRQLCTALHKWFCFFLQQQQSLYRTRQGLLLMRELDYRSTVQEDILGFLSFSLYFL